MQIRSLKTSPGFPLAADTLFRGCWEYQLGRGETATPHVVRRGEEINLILEGRGVVTVGEQTHEVCEGELFFVPAEIGHSIENPFEPPLRGLVVEAHLPHLNASGQHQGRVTLRDLEEVIQSIPAQFDAPQALQCIIRLFDLAGYLSEQIEQAIGLDTTTGLETLARIENQVMEAVVQISRAYSGDAFSERHPRF